MIGFRVLLGVVAIVVAATTAACSSPHGFPQDAGTDSGPAPLPGLTSLAVSPANAQLSLPYADPIVAVTQPFTAMGTFQDGSTQDVTSEVAWETDANSGAMIDSSGHFSSTLAGAFHVTASSGSISASVVATVKLTGNVVTGSVDPSKLDGTPSGSAPTIAYPLDGALFPYGLGPIGFQMVPSASGQSIGRVAFSGDLIDLRVYGTCDAIQSPAIAGGCTITVPSALEHQLDAASSATNMQETVRLAASDGTNLAESTSIDVRWTSSALSGGLYYWSAQTVASGGKNLLMRYDLDTPGTPPEQYYTDADTAKLEPQTQYYQQCFGCHSISLDGTKIALTFGGSVPSLFALLDVSKKMPLTDGTNSSIRYSDGDGPSNFVASQGYATTTVFSPDGTSMIQSFRGQLLPRAADPTLDSLGNALFTSGSPIPSGEALSQPFWSAKGDMLAFISFVPDNSKTQGILTGDVVQGAQIWLAPMSGNTPGTPTLAVPRTTNKTEFYPNISDDSAYMVFNESDCSGPPTPSSSNWGLGPCDGYDDPSAKLRLMDLKSNAIVNLDRASGTDTWTNSWPHFAPTHGSFQNKTLYWIAFSSRRPYGATLAGSDVGNSTPQLWFTAIAVDSNGLASDVSFAPIWMPSQNGTDAMRGNHSPQWVTKAVPVVN